MKEVQQSPYYRQLDAYRLTRVPTIMLHFAVPPNEVIAWRALSDCKLSARNARIWLTRAGSDYDFWLQPGEPSLCLQRGERIWLSTDATIDAEVSVSMANSGAVLRVMQVMSRLFR